MPTHAPSGQLKARLKRASASQRAVGAIGGVAAGLAVLYGVVELLLEGHFDYVFVAMEVGLPSPFPDPPPAPRPRPATSHRSQRPFRGTREPPPPPRVGAAGGAGPPG